MSRFDEPTRELTEKETKLLQLLADGETYKTAFPQIGSLSYNAVKKHMKEVLDKLGADNKTHAVAIAMRRGLIN